jgi:hypothetical protein
MDKDNEHIKKLTQARDRLVEQRRALVEALAMPRQRGDAESPRDAFLSVQTMIEALERAMAHERSMVP